MANVRTGIKNNSSFQTQAKGCSGTTGYQMAEPFLCQGLWQIRDLKLSAGLRDVSDFLRRDAAEKIENSWPWPEKATKSTEWSFAGSLCCLVDGRHADSIPGWTGKAQAPRSTAGGCTPCAILKNMKSWYQIYQGYSSVLFFLFSTYLLFICIFIYIYKNTYIKKNHTD